MNQASNVERGFLFYFHTSIPIEHKAPAAPMASYSYNSSSGVCTWEKRTNKFKLNYVEMKMTNPRLSET